MPYRFFSGKGGVGKTSLAAATAVALADAGARVLLVTTDPASNLADVFQQVIGPAPRAIDGVPGLEAQEIDAEAAAAAYRQQALEPLRGVLPDAMLATVEEQMSGPCTVDVAGFDEFVHCMVTTDFDEVVFDTAPTGHTLRLLALPAAWTDHITEASQGSGQTCLGPVDQLRTSKAQYEAALATLQDPTQTTFVLVTQAERAAVAETLRAAEELKALGLVEPQLIVNGVIPDDAADHPFFTARRAMQEDAMATLEQAWGQPVGRIPLQAGEITGLTALRALGKWVRTDVPISR
ncbi:MAG: TRC40/GET3/ArsA family transport-energizing ATPase [Clostridia bacterium]